MQRAVDNLLAVTKESVKTVTYEALNNVVRLINGVSAMLLALLPGKASILEGIQGWELRPTFRGPRLPRWMENGVSSFNQFIHKLSVDSDSSTSVDYSSDGEDSSGKQHHSVARSPRRLQAFVQRATDRRRGIVEDLHLAIEVFIESAFDVVHKAAQCLLAPIDTTKRVFWWVSSRISGDEEVMSEGYVKTSVLADDSPTPVERKTSFNNSLNTDARTCKDVITELGYPYEAVRVVTSDGYVLHLERIPRRESRKVVYLQHGILDSSMGYWNYSINEHGTEDIPAMIDKIHEIKTSELRPSHPNPCPQPYKLCAIAHSLGGAAALIYVVTQRILERPHRLSRLILLSPAGFHHDSGPVFTLAERLFLLFAPLVGPFVPAFYIPTRFFRMLLNKLARDFHNLPAVGGLVQTLMGYVVGGDSSNWVGVLGLPHYNMNDMPGVSFRVALHLAQMKRAGRFLMFDYGGPGPNLEVYGEPGPLDVGEYYGFVDVLVDLVAGRKDRVIRPSMVRKHYRVMKDAHVEVSYREFEYAHLDFTFSHREELLAYVMSRLMLVVGPTLGDPTTEVDEGEGCN